MNHFFNDIEKQAEQQKPLSVSQLSSKISATLESRIGRVDVIGQVNGPKLGRHWYFSLVDEDAKIDCAMWASKVSSIVPAGWQPKQGDLVHVRAQIGHYSKFGRTQLYVEKIKPAGKEKGALQLQYEALLKELRGKGWFEQSYKKALPLYPKKIAVLTSASSAAVKDVIETARQRWPAVELCIVNVPVQGDLAVPAITKALKCVDQAATSLGIDAIIVTRGGGALEDLWAFNDCAVAAAAFACKTPIVAAIGHESDTTIIELVADHRASTPTQAVMVLIPDADELMQMISHFDAQLTRSLQLAMKQCAAQYNQHAVQLASCARSFLQHRKTTILTLSELLMAKRPHVQFQQRQKRTLLLTSRLHNGMAVHMQHRHSKVLGFERTLAASSPLAVLSRGFSLTQDEKGQIVRSISGVQKDTKIKTRLADGTIDSKVECAYE